MSSGQNEHDIKAEKRLSIASPKDFWGGLAIIAVSVIAFWELRHLSSMRGYSFGAGTMPRLIVVCLIVLGGLILVRGLFAKGTPIAAIRVRGPFFLTASIIVFAVAVRPMGLPLSSMAAFLVAALASKETRWVETIVVGVVVSLLCSLLFIYGLGLPFALAPRF